MKASATRYAKVPGGIHSAIFPGRGEVKETDSGHRLQTFHVNPRLPKHLLRPRKNPDQHPENVASQTYVEAMIRIYIIMGTRWARGTLEYVSRVWRRQHVKESKRGWITAGT